MKELLDFLMKRQAMDSAMTKTAAVLSDGVFGTCRRPPATEYNLPFEEEADRILSTCEKGAKTAERCFELGQLYKFGLNDYFPGIDIAADFPRAAYWFLVAADMGHKGAFKFLHRMVPCYFMENTSADDKMIGVIEALVLQEKLAKACPEESLEERKMRESLNDLVIDMALYPPDEELNDAFWFDSALARFLAGPRKNNVICFTSRTIFKGRE